MLTVNCDVFEVRVFPPVDVTSLRLQVVARSEISFRYKLSSEKVL